MAGGTTSKQNPQDSNSGSSTTKLVGNSLRRNGRPPNETRTSADNISNGRALRRTSRKPSQRLVNGNGSNDDENLCTERDPCCTRGGESTGKPSIPPTRKRNSATTPGTCSNGRSSTTRRSNGNSDDSVPSSTILPELRRVNGGSTSNAPRTRTSTSTKPITTRQKPTSTSSETEDVTDTSVPDPSASTTPQTDYDSPQDQTTTELPESEGTTPESDELGPEEHQEGDEEHDSLSTTTEEPKIGEEEEVEPPVGKRKGPLEYDLEYMYPEIELLTKAPRREWDYNDPETIRAIWLEAKTHALADWKEKFGRIDRSKKVEFHENNALRLRNEFRRMKQEKEEEEIAALVIGKDAPHYQEVTLPTTLTAQLRYKLNRSEPPIPERFIFHFAKFKKPPFILNTWPNDGCKLPDVGN